MTAKTITQAELENFRQDQQLLRATRENARRLEDVVSAREKDLIERIDAGAKFEGFLTAVVDRSETRRITPWKQVARDLWEQLKLNADVMENKTKELTKPTIYPHVVVQEKGGK